MLQRYLILLPALAGLFLLSCSSDYYSLNYRLNDLNTSCVSNGEGVTIALEDFRAALPLDNVSFELYDPATGAVEHLSRDCWSAAPIYLLNGVLRESLAQAAPFNRKVTILPAGSRADYTMSGAFTQMRIESDDDDPRHVEIAFHLRLFRWGADPARDAPVLENTYRRRADVPDECVARIPEALDGAMATAINTFMGDLCERISDPPLLSDPHLVVANTPCRETCAFRFEAGAGERGHLSLAILDRDGDVVEQVDLVKLVAAGTNRYRGTATGPLQGLDVTIRVSTHTTPSTVAVRGLLRGEISLDVTDPMGTATGKWLEKHVGK